MNKTIEITEEKIQAALQVASPETKKVLSALFSINDSTPTLNDYKTIKTYEDACDALGISPILNCPNMYVCEKHPENAEMHVHFSERIELPSHIVALMKLETISKALWGKDFQPKPEAEGNETYWYPYFALYTKEEVERMDEDNFGALLSAYAYYGTYAGFGCLASHYRSSVSFANVGFRLCQENPEKARYFGTQFIELWAEYISFNFTTGARLTR